MPLVSVMIITYNQEAFIADAIEGVLAQSTSFPFELIIADDHSTDRTTAICAEYAQSHPQLIRHIIREKNLGVARNFFTTMGDCRGEYIALCEGDDYWTDPEKLQTQADVLQSDGQSGYVFTNSVIRHRDGIKTPNRQLTKNIPASLELNDVFKLKLMPMTATVMFRKALLPAPLPEFLFKCHHADWALLVLIASRSGIRYIDKVTSVYRDSVGVQSSTSQIVKVEMGIALNQELNSYTRFMFDKFLGNLDFHYGLLALEHLRLRNRRKGMYWMFRSLIHSGRRTGLHALNRDNLKFVKGCLGSLLYGFTKHGNQHFESVNKSA